jgi:hypothetical protein
MLSQSLTHRLPRLASITAIVFALAAPAAGAAVTQTNITSPANHAVIVNNEVTSEPQVTVTGTAPGASDGETVNIICTEPTPTGLSTSTLNSSPVAIHNHGFTYTGSFEPIEEHTCVLRAVPTGATPADLTPFTGPQIAVDASEAGNIGAAEDEAIVGGPNSGALYDYYFYGSQFQGAGEYLSISACGLCDSYAINPTTSAIGSSLFFANAALFSTNDAKTGSEIQIDGNNAFASDAARNLISRTNPTTYNGSEDYSSFPSLSVRTTVNPLTGDVSIEEAGSFSHCVGGNPSGETATHANCSSFEPTGVGYTRHIVQNEDGALVTIYDTFTSTDGAPHQLNLLYYQSVDGNGSGSPAYSFPWLSSAFETPAAKASIAPPAGPASILVKEKAGQADGDEELDQGALTMSAPPNGIEFGEHPTYFELHYTRTVPAGGSVSIGQSFATAFALANVEALARQARSDFSPTVAISTPASGSTSTSSTVTVKGTVGAGANGLPSTVSVNGVSAAVSAEGAWSAQVPLTVGANTITATTTDQYGLQGSAQVAVTYAPPPPPPPPITASATLLGSSYNGKDVLLRIACRAGGATCTGRASAIALEKIAIRSHHHRGRHSKTRFKTVQLTVAAGSFSIPAGQTQTLELKVGRTATDLLAGLHRLPTTITVEVSEPGRLSEVVIGRLTLVYHRPKRHGHRR